jgi:hypothetical protein
MRDRGAANVVIDEAWEQWLKEASERGILNADPQHAVSVRSPASILASLAAHRLPFPSAANTSTAPPP